MVEEGNGLNIIKETYTLLLSRKKTILITTMIFILVGVIFTFFIRSKNYVATSSIMFGRVADYIPQEGESQLLSEIQFNSSIIGNYKNFIRSDEVLKTVMNNLQIDEKFGDFKEDISLRSTGSNIDILVTNEDEKMAENIANELVDVFVQKSKDFYKIEHTYTINYADETTTESDVNHVTDLILFAVIGLVISGSFVYIKYLINPTIIIEENLENKFNLSLLGIITNTDTEQYDLIRTNMELYSKDFTNIKTIFIASPDELLDNSIISKELATSCANNGKKVLLIDADKQNRKLDKYLQIDSKKGFYDYIVDDKSDITGLKTKIKNLEYISLGNLENKIAQKDSILKFNERISLKYDLIFFNGSELLKNSDSRLLSNICDLTIITAKKLETKENDIKETVKEIKKSKGNAFGAIIIE